MISIAKVKMPSKISTTYDYQPLEFWKHQLRLLKVTRDHNGPVRCSLCTLSLSTAPVYSALSYTWGPELPSAKILVDGKTFKVRQNLFQFLQGIRKEEGRYLGGDYLFIDQICIDQSNFEERNHQVQLMSRIDRLLCPRRLLQQPFRKASHASLTAL